MALAQINPTVGDLAGNAALVRQNVAALDAHKRGRTYCDLSGDGA
jgi:hypothetical protein